MRIDLGLLRFVNQQLSALGQGMCIDEGWHLYALVLAAIHVSGHHHLLVSDRHIAQVAVLCGGDVPEKRYEKVEQRH